jgi:hypothetical protein
MSIILESCTDPLFMLRNAIYWDPKDKTIALLISKIFSHLNLSDWEKCCLVSKSWKNRLFSDRHHPLLVAVRTNQIKVVEELLQKGACAKLRMDRSHFTETVNCTPYIYAKASNDHEIANLLKSSDGSFSKNYIKNKLLTLQFELRSFNLEGYDFNDGLEHFVHHDYLEPWITHSLKQFLDKYKNENWNPEKTQKLIALLEASFCLSCHPEPIEEYQIRIKNKESFFLSDTSMFDHHHWISIALINHSWLVLGDRGMGSHAAPGVKIFKITPEFSWDSLSSSMKTFDLKLPARSFLLTLPGQRSGSCAMTSLEAAVIGAIFLLMIEGIEDSVTKIAQDAHTQAAKEAENIFYAWRKERQIALLEQIMAEDGAGYDPSVFTRAFAHFDTCEQTARCFWNFLISKGMSPWESTPDANCAITLALQEEKNDIFLRLVAENITGKEAHRLLKRCLCWEKYSAAEILCKNGTPLNGNGDDCHSLFWDELESACVDYDVTNLQWVLEHGANPNELKDRKPDVGIHPLTWILKSHSPNIQARDLLIKYGSNPQRITFRCKIPSGQQLFVRGNENGLNWEKGTLLVQLDDINWIYQSSKPLKDMEYKLLINDSIWEDGDNHKLIRGKIDETTPHFALPPSISGDILNPSIPETQMTVRFDTGFGNQLFLRGNGPGLSWEKGIELQNISNDIWVYKTQPNFEHFEYKVLLNDKKWEDGCNRKTDCGKKEEIIPKFS